MKRENNYKFENVPEELKGLNQWVCWKAVQDTTNPDRIKKVPINPTTGNGARSNNPETWASFDVACEAYKKNNYTGIGFMFDNGYFGVDIDDCTDDAEGRALMKEFIETLNSYAEYSPSGKGIHIICKGNIPEGGNRRGQVEIYEKARYFTVTGNIINHHKFVRDCSNTIKALHKKYILNDTTDEAKNQAQNEKNDKKEIPRKENLLKIELLEKKDNSELMNKIIHSKRGAEFFDTYSGKWQGRFKSQSEADMSICSTLAFWTGRDRIQMDEIFRTSNLMRLKWDEKNNGMTYGEITIEKACTNCTNVYTGNIKKGKKKEEKKEELLTSFPVIDAEGKAIKAHWENTDWLFKQMGFTFKYNELTKRVEITKEKLKELTFDSMVVETRGYCHKYDYKISQGDLIGHIGRIAEENKYNPIKDYLIDCKAKWDGIDRIEALFNCFVLDENAEQDYDILLELFKKWLVTCVKMAFNDGEEAAQGVLILKGAQGIGKTRWLGNIVPVKKWVKEGASIDFGQKDDLIRALSYWIVELGEIGATMRRKEIDRLKAFITESTDAIRMPYGRTMEVRPRQTVFFGTVNNEQFLKDDTGERRNWVIAIKDIKDTKDIDINQLWGEITVLALDEKYPHWLTKEQMQMLNKQNETYKSLGAEEQLLLDSLEWEADKIQWIKITASELCNILEVNNARSPLMAKALRRLSDRGVELPTNKTIKKYKIPPFRNKLFNEQFKRITDNRM